MPGCEVMRLEEAVWRKVFLVVGKGDEPVGIVLGCFMHDAASPLPGVRCAAADTGTTWEAHGGLTEGWMEPGGTIVAQGGANGVVACH